MQFTLHPKEKRYFRVMSILSLCMYGFLIGAVVTGKVPFSIVALYIGSFLLVRLLLSLFLMGFLKGNGIKVTEKQFPEAYALLKQHAAALDFHKIPEMYLLQAGGVLNAFATRVGGRDFVVVYADVLEVAYREGIDAVSFIIGHEVGHIKRNHVGFLKSLLLTPASFIPFLSSAYSRACEYTCDNIGAWLSPAGATAGILILAAGKNLYKKVNSDELMRTLKEDTSFALWFAEIFSSHPSLIKRVAHVQQLKREQGIQGHPYFVSPKINLGHEERHH